MQTECCASPSLFTHVERRPVVADFDRGAVSSDAGGLLLGATDRAIDLIRRFALCFKDRRRRGADRVQCCDIGGTAGVRNRARL